MDKPVLNLTAGDYFYVLEGLRYLAARQLASGNIDEYARVIATREKIEAFADTLPEPQVRMVTQDEDGEFKEQRVGFSEFIEKLREIAGEE